MIQFESILGDPAASRTNAEAMIREAAAQGAELICLPELPVYDTKLGKIGIVICFDAGFPEAARILQMKGAEIILCPSKS